MSVAAFVLTGGHSTRMGRDKALLPYGDGTLVERVAQVAQRAAGVVHLVGAPERYVHLGFPCLSERYEGCGPMSGIEAALRHGFDWNLIVACDMPRLDDNWLGRLVGMATGGMKSAVVAAHADGRLEPLCAVYHARLQTHFETALAEGRFSVWKLLETIDFSRFAVDDEEYVANLNTMDDWARWGQ
ncbi:molybdenum cofactor guanylyltransferase [uncultured Paludibaculum sp.]|uniref:molybdenum cofactor guanylyltransferase n=1 Tax=uncultured Paludibaculum sp. TaxID=1765020 RepID=UPI002AAC2DD1|nr:molybdenum cofactor guanylyltransferase [uncultured Paludibaculum sp.]